jgi:hypothetical protein
MAPYFISQNSFTRQLIVQLILVVFLQNEEYVTLEVVKRSYASGQHLDDEFGVSSSFDLKKAAASNSNLISSLTVNSASKPINSK